MGKKRKSEDGNAIKSMEDIIKSWKEIVDSNILPQNMLSVLEKVDESAHNVLKQFGQGREMIQGLKQSMTGAVDAIKLLGGTWSDIEKMQLKVSDTLGRNLVLSTESYEGLYAASEVAGVSADRMVSSFKDAGISAYNASSEMGKVVNTAREIGVNAQAVSGKVLDNMDTLNKYNFEGGVQGLAKMAAQATMLRVDMSNIFTVVEKAFNPESAIELAAGLQRLGVAQSDLLDPLRLMDLAQNDPAELQNQISKMSQQFVQLKKDGTGFEIMPGAKRQLMEVEQQLGMARGSLAKMALGSAELDDKMNKIKFPDLGLTEEQKTLIANMSEMKDGTYKIEVGGQTKNIAELKGEDLELLKKVGEPKTMEQLAKDQLSTLDDIKANTLFMKEKVPYALAGSKAGQGVLEAGRAMSRIPTKVLPEELSIKNLTKGINTVSVEVTGALKGMANNTMSVSEGLEKLSGIFTKGGDFVEKTWNKSVGNLTGEFDKLGINVKSLNELFKNITDGKTTAKPVKQTGDFISTPNADIQLLPQDTIFAMTKGEEFLKGLGGNNKETTNTTSSSTMDVNLNHTITINAPSGVDTQQLVLALKNEEIKQSIVQSILKGMTNDGRTASNSNPQQRMNSFMNLA
jgi:hypothetical protein